MTGIIERYLHLLGVKVTGVGLKKCLESVALPNTLYGIVSVLNRYGIQNVCHKVENPDELSEVEMPSLILFGGAFCILLKFTGDKVEIEGGKGKKMVVEVSDFMKKWNRVILAPVGKTEGSEVNYESNLKLQRFRKLKIAGLSCALMVLVGVGIALNRFFGEVWFWLQMILNAVGLYISYLLLQKQLHIKNGVADKLCSLIKQNHCENVTESKGSVVVGDVKWTETGGGYFMSNFMALVFFPFTVKYLAVTSVAVLPFSLWSVWYQKRKVKTWCVLCLFTLVVMWGIAFVSIYGGLLALPWSNSINLLFLMALYVGVTLGINGMMGILSKKKNEQLWHEAYKSLKMDKITVDAHLKNGNRFATGEDDCSCLVFGNPNAGKQIVIFSNPYCGPCAALHKRLANIPWNEVGIRYVMTYFTTEKSVINKYIIAYYKRFGERKTWEMLNLWYEGGKERGEEFFKSFDLDPNSAEVSAEFEKQEKWRTDARLRGTPTSIFNGHEITSPYEVEDFIYNPG